MAGAAPEGSGHQAGSEVAHPRPCWRRERKLPEGLGETRPKLGGPGELLCIEAGRTGEEPKSHVMSGISPPQHPRSCWVIVKNVLTPSGPQVPHSRMRARTRPRGSSFLYQSPSSYQAARRQAVPPPSEHVSYLRVRVR